MRQWLRRFVARFGGHYRHRRPHLDGVGGAAHAELLPRGKLRQVHAVSRGTTWLEEILIRMENGGGRRISTCRSITTFIAARASARLASLVWGLQSNLAKYRPEFESYIELTNQKMCQSFQSARSIGRTPASPVCCEAAMEPEGDSPLNWDTPILAKRP